MTLYYRDNELFGNLRCGCQVRGDQDTLVHICRKHLNKGLRLNMTWKEWGPRVQELQRELEQEKMK